MTFTEIKGQIALQTQQKIERMKDRNIVVPAGLVDRCELCNQLAREIYDFAVATLIKIVKRHHLHLNTDALLNALHQDFCELSNGAIEVLIARQSLQCHATSVKIDGLEQANRPYSGSDNHLISAALNGARQTNEGNEPNFSILNTARTLSLLWNWIKSGWNTRIAFHFK